METKQRKIDYGRQSQHGGGIKTRIFTDRDLAFETKWDLWKAAIGSILTYSLTTTKQTKTMVTKLQIFVFK